MLVRTGTKRTFEKSLDEKGDLCLDTVEDIRQVLVNVESSFFSNVPYAVL